MSSAADINKYKSDFSTDYDKCLGVIDHEYTISGMSAQIRLHYLKLDGNGRPMAKALARMLYTYIIEYCIASRNRPGALSPQQAASLTQDARSLFRHPSVAKSPDKTGEAGELLLYFLMEAVLGAPQVVSKMELKTNHKDEIKGSDGIHARFNEETNLVDFFFGESKLYQSSSSAISDAIKSVEQFHDIEMYQHEFNMVTKHFKHADNATKTAITSLIINGEPGDGICLNHACLIGYDFKEFANFPIEKPLPEVMTFFLEKFMSDGQRLTNLVQKRFDAFEKKHIKFQVFFIPFPSVSDFRDHFNEALN